MLMIEKNQLSQKWVHMWIEISHELGLTLFVYKQRQY